MTVEEVVLPNACCSQALLLFLTIAQWMPIMKRYVSWRKRICSLFCIDPPLLGGVVLSLKFLDDLSFVYMNGYAAVNWDLNINALKTSSTASELLIILKCNNYRHNITTSTHITPVTCSLIGMFITNVSDGTIKTNIVSSDISDHLPLLSLLKQHLSNETCTKPQLMLARYQAAWQKLLRSMLPQYWGVVFSLGMLENHMMHP